MAQRPGSKPPNTGGIPDSKRDDSVSSNSIGRPPGTTPPIDTSTRGKADSILPGGHEKGGDGS